MRNDTTSPSSASNRVLHVGIAALLLLLVFLAPWALRRDSTPSVADDRRASTLRETAKPASTPEDAPPVATQERTLTYSGLDITLVNPLPQHATYRIRFLRVFDEATSADDERARRAAIRRLNAALWNSYDWPPEAADPPGFPDYSTSLVLSAAATTRVWPLFPDASTRLVLFAPSGEVSLPLDVALEPDAIKPLEIDVASLFPAGARSCVDLDGRIVHAFTGQPVVGAIVTRNDQVGQFTPATTDTSGAFRYSCLPTQAITQFRVRIPPDNGLARPVVAREHTYSFVPPLFATNTQGATASVVWEIPRLHWMVVPLDQQTDERLRRESGPGFPRHFVQRWNDETRRWDAQLPDELVFEGSGFAAGVARPGRWRAVIATNPLELTVTDQAIVDEHPGEHRLGLAATQPARRPRSLLVTSALNGYAVERLEVAASAAPEVLGWSHFVTDDRGIVGLGDVNADRVELRLGMPPGDRSHAIELTEEPRELIELSLETP